MSPAPFLSFGGRRRHLRKYGKVFLLRGEKLVKPCKRAEYRRSEPSF
ncbi:hypothetical protein GCWU000246_00833 [Jonquetella anthropi E3_33 E1]|nr:hypothetical protein GCWU000246_00833 [Jonquetella anthropi E3_33 E1]